MSIETKDTRRRLDPAERREELLTAAATLFGERPYSEVTMDDVASAANASQALVFRYFSTKAELYAAVVRRALAAVAAAQGAALEKAGPGEPLMGRLRLTTGIYVDFVGANARNWSARGGAGEPPEALAIRDESTSAYVEALRELLAPSTALRHEFALWGFMGFVDAACAHWVSTGCPDEAKAALVETCLGSLEGALGDWAG